VNSRQLENNDRSVIISIDKIVNSTFFIISKLDEYLNIKQSLNKLNSYVVSLNIKPKNRENIQITFRHLVRENLKTRKI
jgi:hypothetical protein